MQLPNYLGNKRVLVGSFDNINNKIQVNESITLEKYHLHIISSKTTGKCPSLRYEKTKHKRVLSK